MSELKVNSIKGTSASTAAITVNSSDGTCTANITNNLSNRRLTINGAMTIAQRGSSTTTSGGYCVDRIQCFHGGTDEAPTFAQADVASGTTPYTLGFRKCLKVTNGNQTSGAGAADYVWLQYKIEAQDIANSGWNYVSSSNYITLSFWVKSSVEQDFKGFIQTFDGTAQSYPFATGSLSADTWTKVTKTIAGNSNLQFDNNNNVGMNIQFLPFFGTDYTASSATENAWQAYSSSARCKDSTSTWYTTNDATFEITGLQLEVGSVATDFEHRSYGQELELCRRYYQLILDRAREGEDDSGLGGTPYSSTSGLYVPVRFHPIMRTKPTVESSTASGGFRSRHGDLDAFESFSGFNTATRGGGTLIAAAGTGKTVGHFYWIETNTSSGKLAVSAEL